MLEDLTERLRPVLATQAYPAQRWELITAAENYGADFKSRLDLQTLPVASYKSFTHVVTAIRRGRASTLLLGQHAAC